MSKYLLVLVAAVSVFAFPSMAKAYEQQGSCFIASDQADYIDGMTLNNETGKYEYNHVAEGAFVWVREYSGYSPVFIYSDDAPSGMTNDPVYYHAPFINHPSLSFYDDLYNWTGNDADWWTACALGFVTESAPTIQSTLMPLASSTQLVEDINGNYGYIAFSALAGFLGMMFIIHLIVYAYRKVRERFAPGKDDVQIV